MGDVLEVMKAAWLAMLEPPWRDPEGDADMAEHWFVWLAGWAWILGGLVLGALLAPPIMQAVGLAGKSFTDWLVIAVAVLVAFLIQVLGWLVLSVIDVLFLVSTGDVVFWPIVVAISLVPLAGIGYGIYRYLTWVGAGQRTVTIAFVAALLIKTFAIPLIKSIVTGALLRWFVGVLRGKDKKSV